MYQLKLEKFEGPLDLLLQMIEQDKLNISEISLAEMADQYVEYITLNKDTINANELSDFLLVAAKLLLIKSRYLMPFLKTEEDEEIGDLETRLKIYKEFLEASRGINTYYENGNTAFSRPIFLPEKEASFYPPKQFSAGNLKEMFESLLSRLTPSFKIDEERFEKRVTVQEKLDQIKILLLKQVELGFSNLLGTREKSEIIVSFLAVLELVKQRFIFVEQEGYFEEIVIKRTN